MAKPSKLEFVTEPIEHAQHPDVEFGLDGETYRASFPAEIHLERIVGAMSGMATHNDKVYALLRFLDACVHEGDRMRIEARFADPDDVLKSATQLIPIAFELCAQWGADTAQWEMPAVIAPQKKAAPKKAAAGSLKPARPARRGGR